MKQKLIALWDFEYDQKPVKRGDVFEASEEDAKLMLLRGSAEPEKSAPQKRRYQRRDMRADS